MLLWRISSHADLKGTGGLKAGGRWHSSGQPVVYLSESPASALLEVCVHTAANDVPPTFRLLRIEGPDLPFQEITIEMLPAGWPDRLDLTRELGTSWLNEQRTVLLQVPSALVPNTQNYLFNPLHPDARLFNIVATIHYPFDLRIKQ